MLSGMARGVSKEQGHLNQGGHHSGFAGAVLKPTGPESSHMGVAVFSRLRGVSSL